MKATPINIEEQDYLVVNPKFEFAGCNSLEEAAGRARSQADKFEQLADTWDLVKATDGIISLERSD